MGALIWGEVVTTQQISGYAVALVGLGYYNYMGKVPLLPPPQKQKRRKTLLCELNGHTPSTLSPPINVQMSASAPAVTTAKPSAAGVTSSPPSENEDEEAQDKNHEVTDRLLGGART